MAARAVDETLKRQALVPGVGRVIDDRTVGQRLHHTWHPEHLVGRLVVQEHEDRGRACSQRGFGALAQATSAAALPGERFQIATRLPCLSNAWAMMVPMAPSPITDTSNSKLSSLCSRTLEVS
jgi:hypothetical protein